MNYSARINIKVKSPEVWTKLLEMDTQEVGLDIPASDLFDQNTLQFVLDEDSEWTANEFQTSAFCRYVSAVAPEDCIIIADCTDSDAENQTHYCYWYAGSPYVAAYMAGYSFDPCMEIYEEDGRLDMREKTDIHDIAGWFTYLGQTGNPKLKAHLAEYGIEL